jgi:hypothetical protein
MSQLMAVESLLHSALLHSAGLQNAVKCDWQQLCQGEMT